MSCQTNPAWQATVQAYLDSSADSRLGPWWTNAKSSGLGFAADLARSFGEHQTGVTCGIEEECPLPDCSAFQNNSDPVWAYHAMLSTSNLNQFFNNIYNGVSQGQPTFTDEIDNVATLAIPIKNPKFVLGDVTFWLVAILTSIFAFVPLIGEGGATAVASASGIGAFSGAGVQHATDTLAPSDPSGALQELSSIEKLRNSTAVFGQTSCQAIEDWANNTFAGANDQQGKSIIDYLHGGAYEVIASLPQPTEIGRFYTSQLVARAVNSQWRTQMVWITRMANASEFDNSGPNQTKYYDSANKAVYYAYRYNGDGILRGHVDKPWGLDQLSNEPYNILGSDITKSSARAWVLGGFNYTNEMALKNIQDSVSSEGKLTPFQDGAGWIGSFTLPVCDMGTKNWNSQYDDRNSSYGIFPCCCGPQCKDTKEFISQSNLVGLQTLLRACKKQLANTDIAFKRIDYGFKWKKSLPLWWADASTKLHAAVGVGIVGGGLLVLTLLICCCCGILS